MHYHLTTSDTCSIASITTPDAATVVAYLTVDIHDAVIKQKAAASLLYCDLMLSGAGPYNRAQWLDAVNQLGATIAVSASTDLIQYTIRCRSEVLSKTLALFSTMITTPSFATKELTRAKQTLINHIHEAKEDSRSIAHYNLSNCFYDSSDRRFTIDEDAVAAETMQVTTTTLKAVHTAVCTGAWVCSVSGTEANIKRVSTTITKLRKIYQNTQPKQTNQAHKSYRPTFVHRHIPSKQNIDFSIGVPLPIDIHHPDYVPLTIALAVLGKWGGFAGRLMSTVREQEGLTYGIYARTESFFATERGYWRVLTFFSPEQTLQGLTSTYREITKLWQEGITQTELDRFKAILSTGLALQADSNQSLLRELHSYHTSGFTLDEIAAHKEKLTRVTLDAVNEVITQYCDPKQLSLSAAGPINKQTLSTLKTFFASVS